MRAAPEPPSMQLTSAMKPSLKCDESLRPGSLKSIRVVRLDNVSPTPLERESLTGRKRVLPSFMGKTFYPSSPPASPTPSEEGAQFLDRMGDALIKLNEYAERRTAEWRRENTDFFEGETPRTSQESNASQNSEFSFSQRSVADIASKEEVVEFVFDREDHAFLRDALQPFLGRTDDSPEEFRAAATTLLFSTPKALAHVLGRVLERARQRARKEQMEKERREAVRRRADRESLEAEVEYIRREFPDLH